MNEIKVFPIGKIENDEGGFKVTLDPEYKDGLKGLADYSRVQVLWWFDGCNNQKDRGTLIEQKPYKTVPEWCRHWPKSYEESSTFNWEAEFNF